MNLSKGLHYDRVMSSYLDQQNKLQIFLAIKLPVYLHLIFEILSVTRFFFNFKILSLKNQKINLISKLIFAGYTGSKNQVRTRQKIQIVSKSIFFFLSLKLKKNQVTLNISKIKWR